MELRPGDVLPPRKRRAGNPKSRSGCFVCKSRRIKCDERKPGCHRCESYGVQCSGYAIARDRSLSARATKLLPVLQRREMTVPQLAFHQPSNLLPGETATEHQYLSYFASFCEEDKSRTSGPFGGPLWTKLMLQAGRNYEFTRHGLVALGAINKSLERENAEFLRKRGSKLGMKSMSTPTSHVAEAQHREFALREYQKALAAMKEAPIETSYNHRVRRALISLLVIIYFEKFLRNDAEVLRQMLIAQALLEDWFSMNPLTHPGISTPIPETVEEELVKTFNRLDLQVMHFQDPRPLKSHQFQTAYNAQMFQNMPMRFRVVEEARHMWDILACRVSHFMIGAGQAADATPLGRVLPDEDITQWSTISTLYMYGSPVLYSQAARDQAAIHVREIQHWLSAFEPLYRSSQLSSDLETRLLTFQIKSNAMIWAAIPHSVLFTTEMDFEVYRPSFQEILSMITSSHGAGTDLIAVMESMNTRGYAIDLGGAMPIFFLGLKCRERKLRNMVFTIIEWMAKNWKGSVMPKPPMMRVLLEVFKWIKGIEEDGLGPLDEIPAGRRAALTRFMRHKVTNVVMMQCIRRCPGEAPVWHDKSFKVAGFGEF